MRLLHAKTLKFGEFFDVDIPTYAILSHRWETGEITYREILKEKFKHEEFDTNRPGWLKVINTCARAVVDGLEWVWVDTCCIDKSSSAELSEAINSMFKWYRASKRCYVYLNDVSVDRNFSLEFFDWTTPEGKNLLRAFGDSAWFTRGWTLQELIAPRECSFYSNEWIFIGERWFFHSNIYRITGITEADLNNPRSQSISRRMSWMANRVTSREEDLAYSLLGLFDVQMPLLYGEGKTKAFLRLQHTIMQASDDETIFAWRLETPFIQSSGFDKIRIGGRARYDMDSGMLAESPVLFKNSSRYEPIASNRKPYFMTNKGLSIELLLIDTIRRTEDDEQVYWAKLNCCQRLPDQDPAFRLPPFVSSSVQHLGILVASHNAAFGGKSFRRVNCIQGVIDLQDLYERRLIKREVFKKSSPSEPNFCEEIAISREVLIEPKVIPYMGDL